MAPPRRCGFARKPIVRPPNVNIIIKPDIYIEVSKIYTLSVTNAWDGVVGASSVYDIHKAEINDSKKLPVVVTYYSPENSSIIRAVSLQYPVMFIFRVKKSNLFETFVPDKNSRIILTNAFNYTNLLLKLPVISEFSLMKSLAQLHKQPLGQLWKKNETQLQSLRALHESLVQEKTGGGITENYRKLEREMQKSLAAIHDVDWVSEIPKLKQKYILQGEIMHHEYVIKVLKKALDSVPGNVAHAVDELTSMQTKYEDSLTDFFDKFEGTASKRLLARPSKNLDDISSKLQWKNKEALLKPYPWSDYSSSEVINPPIFCKDGTSQEYEYDLLVGRFGATKVQEITYEDETYRVAIDSRLDVWNCRTDPKPERLMNPYDKPSLRNYIRNPTTVRPPHCSSTGAFLIPFKYGLLMSYVCRKPLCGKIWTDCAKRDDHEKEIEDVIRNQLEKKEAHFSYASVSHDWSLLELGVASASPPHADSAHIPGFYDFDDDITDDEASVNSESDDEVSADSESNDETRVDSPEDEDEGARVTLSYQLPRQMFCSSLGNCTFCGLRMVSLMCRRLQHV